MNEINAGGGGHLFQKCRGHGGGGGGVHPQVLVPTVSHVLTGVGVEGQPGGGVAFEDVGLVLEAVG